MTRKIIFGFGEDLDPNLRILFNDSSTLRDRVKHDTSGDISKSYSPIQTKLGG